MSKSTATSRVRATYAFIQAQRTTDSVERLCHVLARRHSHLGGISPEKFEAAHTFRKQAPTRRAHR